MATTDTTALANAFKRVYGDTVTDLFARAVTTYNQFMKSPRTAVVRPGGVGYYFAVRESDIESVGARGEGQFLPEPMKPEFAQGFILPKMIYSSIRLSGLAIEASKGNAAAFIDAQTDTAMSAYQALIMDLNRQCWGDGHGLLATNSATGSLLTGSTWSITCDNDRGIRYVRKGMVCDWYTSGGSVITGASAVRVAEVAPDTGIVKFEAGADLYNTYHPRGAAFVAYTNTNTESIAAGGQLIRYGARDAALSTTDDTPWEISGLNAMYGDASDLGTFQGITISTDPSFVANVMSNSAVNREVSIDLMLAAVDMTAARSTGGCNTIRMGLGQRRKYFGLLAPDIRYTPGTLRGGYEELGFSQNSAIKIVVDPVAQPNRMYFETDGAIKKYELTPIGWGGFDPNKMHWRENYDEATMFLRTYTQLGVENRRALTLIDDLVEPASGPWRSTPPQ